MPRCAWWVPPHRRCGALLPPASPRGASPLSLSTPRGWDQDPSHHPGDFGAAGVVRRGLAGGTPSPVAEPCCWAGCGVPEEPVMLLGRGASQTTKEPGAVPALPASSAFSPKLTPWGQGTVGSLVVGVPSGAASSQSSPVLLPRPIRALFSARVTPGNLHPWLKRPFQGRWNNTKSAPLKPPGPQPHGRAAPRPSLGSCGHAGGLAPGARASAPRWSRGWLGSPGGETKRPLSPGKRCACGG